MSRRVYHSTPENCVHADGTAILNTAPLPVLPTASLVTLFLDNEKNGQTGYHHPAYYEYMVMVLPSTGTHVASVMAFKVPLSAPMSFLLPDSHVSVIHINALIRQATVTTNLMA
jgi:hypothetical protein